MEVLLNLVLEFLKGQSYGAYVILVLSIIGSLNVVATAVIALTPSKKDDEWLAAFQGGKISGLLWVALRNFSLVSQKSKPEDKPLL